MNQPHTFFVLPFRRRQGALEPGELIGCIDEEVAAKRGRAMVGRVSGLAFFRIDTAASGDQWTEIEVLATIGDVPEEAA